MKALLFSLCAWLGVSTGLLADIPFLPNPAVRKNLASVKQSDPEVYREILVIISREQEFKTSIELRTQPYQLTVGEFSTLAYYAAAFNGFDAVATANTFPAINSLTHLIGCAHLGANTAVLIYPENDLPIFAAQETSTRPIVPGENLDFWNFNPSLLTDEYNPTQLTIRTFCGKDYLIATYFPRSLASVSTQQKIVDVILLDQTNPTLVKSETFNFTLPPPHSPPWANDPFPLYAQQHDWTPDCQAFHLHH